VNDFLRARQPEQKEERRAQLLATARVMLEAGTDLRELTLNELARQAGMAKSNVYRYFETREALLLELLWSEWAAWFEALVADPPRRGRGPKALSALAACIARSLARRPLLCKLTAALPSVVEQNLSEERIAEFKAQSLLFFGELARFLHGRVPDLSEARYASLVHDTVTLLVGLYPFAAPAPAVARVLEREAFAFFRRDFEADLARMILALATSGPS
jgi:AcrR family transcriptional regulator